MGTDFVPRILESASEESCRNSKEYSHRYLPRITEEMEKTSLIYDHYPYNPCSDPIDDEESEPSFDIRCPLHDHGGCREGAGDGECEDLTDPELDLIFTRVEGQDNS